VRVLYDYQAFLQRHGGVSRYFAELIAALQELPGFEARLPAFYSDNEYLRTRKTLLTRGHFKGKERLMSWLNMPAATGALSGEFDVFHPTYYRPYFLGRLKRPFVLTVHDMIHEVFSGEHVREDGTSGAKRLLCQRASRIIAVSQNTKRDLCRLLDVREERVTVIHHATRLQYDGAPRIQRERYLLYVGARSGYKNFPRFLLAAAPVLARLGGSLVCVGGGPFTAEEASMVRSAGLGTRLVHRESSSASALANLYHFADALCYPSLYEGFGLPLLEAFACGCPVAASDSSSIPEVAGSAALLFDPRSVESITAALEQVVADQALRTRLVAAGTARLAGFSWAEAARRTLAVYQEAV